MSVTTLWDALKEFKDVVNNTKSIQAELKKWGERLIQFLVKEGEDCFMIIHDGKLLLRKGKNNNPDLTFKALNGHLVNLITGQIDYTSLEIMGNIDFQGIESDKNKFIGFVGLFIAALLGESYEIE